MLGVELRFPAGRYHATPWGRNVNEGLPEWPPSPFRLARALLDVAYRRFPAWEPQRLEAVVAALERPVRFDLPPATQSHIRLWQRQGGKDVSDRAKVFDAFVVVDAERPAVAWFDGEPGAGIREDLDTLLRALNYLGRSESWVGARLLKATEPSEEQAWPRNGVVCQRLTPSAEAADHEVVRLACVRPGDELARIADRPRKKGTKKKPGEPLSRLETLGMSSAELNKGGWSTHPAMWELDFIVPRDIFRGRVKRRRSTLEGRFHEARFALHSPVLPRLVDAVKVAEQVRTKLMGIHRNVVGGDPKDGSLTFAGKAPGGGAAQGHEHAYFLPLDDDGDGRIDHIVVRARAAFDGAELAALDALRTMWQTGNRPDMSVVLESLTETAGAVEGRHWASLTPFVTRRHHRKGRGSYEAWIADELRRACVQHGLPEPLEVSPVPHTTTTASPVRWMEFTRSRKGQSPLRAHGWRLSFAEPVRGPFAVGALAHFGLGLFVPAR